MSQSSSHILMVEDNRAHALLIRRCLDELNVACRTTHLQDGQAAIDYLAGREAVRQTGTEEATVAPPPDVDPPADPDLMLLDLRLPKVDGLDVLAAIKSKSAWDTLPVVVLTTSEARDDIDRAYALGANSYLVKPVSFAALKKTIEAVGAYWLTWNQRPPVAVVRDEEDHGLREAT